jgi:hypothetical protein
VGHFQSCFTFFDEDEGVVGGRPLALGVVTTFDAIEISVDGE